MKKFSLNGIEVFPFASEEQILDHIDKNKGCRSTIHIGQMNNQSI